MYSTYLFTFCSITLISKPVHTAHPRKNRPGLIIPYCVSQLLISVKFLQAKNSTRSASVTLENTENLIIQVCAHPSYIHYKSTKALIIFITFCVQSIVYVRKIQTVKKLLIPIQSQQKIWIIRWEVTGVSANRCLSYSIRKEMV